MPSSVPSAPPRHSPLEPGSIVFNGRVIEKRAREALTWLDRIKFGPEGGLAAGRAKAAALLVLTGDLPDLASVERAIAVEQLVQMLGKRGVSRQDAYAWLPHLAADLEAERTRREGSRTPKKAR